MQTPIVRVFLSSTWLDLEPERKAVEAAIHRMRETKFVGMEYFGSRDEATRRASLDEVDRSDVYVGIFAARHGSGITEAEYHRARAGKLPCFIYFKDDATILDKWRETDPAQTAKLDTLKQKLRANHIVGPDFINPQDLAAKVTADLHRWLFDEYLTPKLEQATRGQASHAEAQTLLDAVRDLSALNRDLLARLRGAGFNVASGERSVAYAGDAEQVNIHTGDTTVYNVLPTAISARHQLRAPVGDFVGREKEIAALTDALRGGGSAGINGISGMGGIGKTELALYVAARLREAYPDAQLFVDMRGTDARPRDAADALADCVRAFAGLEQRLPEALDDLVKLYRAALDGKRALILLDNARDAAQVRPLLPPPGSALLVTSRETIPLPGMKRLTLEQLQHTEARELLTGIAPRVPADIADRICYLCGYLPLAIRAAGSLLDVAADLDPAAYAEQLGDERTRLARIGTEGVDLDVEASISLSYQRLPPDGARVFRQLAVFPATFDAAAEEAVCEDPGHTHLSNLLRRNLVLYDADTTRYRLHDLVRLFTAARLGDEERDSAQLRHATHYLNVLQQADELYRQGGDDIKRGLALFDLEWRNIKAGHSWAGEQPDTDAAAASLCSEYPNAGVHIFLLRLEPEEFISWLKPALNAARRSKDRAAEGGHLGNMGTAYAMMGEINLAITVYEEALVALREVGDRRLELKALGNLGIVYKNSGDLPRAIELQEQSLAGAREAGDRLGEGSALGNLGNVYALLGETERAIEFYEQQLTIAREIGDLDGERKALSNLGTTYAKSGDLPRATDFHERALRLDREIGDQRGEMITLNDLGKDYAASGDPRRAFELFEQSLAIARTLSDRKEEGTGLYLLGMMLDNLGDRGQAIAHAEAALEIFEQIESPYAERVRAQLAQWRGRG